MSESDLIRALTSLIINHVMLLRLASITKITYRRLGARGPNIMEGPSSKSDTDTHRRPFPPGSAPHEHQSRSDPILIEGRLD